MSQPANPTDRPGGSDPHLDDDRRLDLLHGLLPDAERERALAHLEACAACEELLRADAAAHERLRARGAPPALAALPPRATAPSPAGPVRPAAARLRLAAAWRRPPVRWAAVAMAAAAVLALIVLPRGGGDAWPALSRLPAAGGEVLVRGGDGRTAPDGELGRALAAYERGDWDRAAELLSRLEAPPALRTLRDVYLGSALAWQGNHRRAAAVLAPVAGAALPDPWGSEARWTLYVSLRRSGQEARADSLLAVLSREPFELGERARAERSRLAAP